MQPLPWTLLQEGSSIEGDTAVVLALQQVRAAQLFERRMTDATGHLAVKLSAIASAVRSSNASRGTHGAQVGRIAMACLQSFTPPAQPGPRVLSTDWRGAVDHHHDEQVARDELTRLRAREQHYSGRLTEVLSADSVRESIAQPPVQHKTTRRTQPLAAVLAEAQRRALAPTDWQSVWAALVKMAEPASRPAPLLGYVEGEGVQYRADDVSQPVAYLTREAFRKRFGRGGRNQRRTPAPTSGR